MAGGMNTDNNLASSLDNDNLNDGLLAPEVGGWAQKKYKLLQMYNELFATGMKNRWGTRVTYLCSGSGKSRIRKINKVVLGSPLISLSIKDKYNKYIFCEEDKECISALQLRVENEFPQADVHYVKGNCNERVLDIVNLIPRPSKDKKGRTFCFVDPFSLNIEFSTVRKLCEKHFVDFLILLALDMDANRNESIYVEENNNRVDKFLGYENWRQKWKEQKSEGKSFRIFLAHTYANQMMTLGYSKESIAQMIEVRSDEKNLPLYHLAFFSRHIRGYQFWKQVKKYATGQGTLFEDI